MSDGSAIEWTDATWSPVVGCSRVSAGCERCYAETLTHRLAAMGQAKYQGLTRKVGAATRWTGTVRLVPDALDVPRRWRKPRRVFVNPMSDLFHERLSDEDITRVFEVMLETEHVYQVLTKRPARMREWVTRFLYPALLPATLENVWLGVSVEDQAAADERIPLLLQTPAALRFLSVEPLLGPVDLRKALGYGLVPSTTQMVPHFKPGLDWIIVGGESGPGARPCDLVWIRSIVAQCRDAGVPCFVKQLGTVPFASVLDTGDFGPVRVPITWSGDGVGTFRFRLRDRKGGDPAEWPEDLRVREFPLEGGRA